VRKQLGVAIVVMLAFAGFGSSAILARALAQPAAAQKQLGPRPTPRWYWHWAQWRLGTGYAKGHRLEIHLRPKDAPRRIPSWAFHRLQRVLASQTNGTPRKGHGPPTTTTTTVPTPTTTTTTTATTTTTSTTTSGGETYEQAISYTQTRPAFTPTRTVGVSSASQLQTAIANLQPGDLVQATASFTVSGETVIRNRLNAPAELDLTGVSFVYSGGSNTPAVWLDNPQNLFIYGGDLSTSDTGGTCLLDHGSQYVVWWGFSLHDCGGSGFAAFTSGAPVAHDDFQGEIWKVGQNLAWDPHVEKGSGEHGAILWDSNYNYPFTDNRFAFFTHDIPTGACVEVGSNLSAPASGNVLYEKCVNATFVSTIQTGGNALQLWGDTSNLGLDVKFLEGDNLEGYAVHDNGVYSGQTTSGVAVEYGRASNTNLNPRYVGQNPWQKNFGEVYGDLLPAPQ
jgi:hypothetical protein